MSRHQDPQFNQFINIDEHMLTKAVVIAASVMTIVLAVAAVIVTYYCFWQ